MVKYSIVVATMEGNNTYLFQCLDSIKQYTEGSYEVILVINGENQPAEAIGDSFGVRIVKIDDPTHFSRAYNVGLAEAKGDYLVALNDDTIVTPNWNVKLMRCLTNFKKKTGNPEAAMAGPVSNNVGGPQMIPHEIAQKVVPANCQMLAEDIEETNKETWIASTFLSGFCVMIKRSFYNDNSPEFFDERLKNGAEDNLISLKALFQGKSLAICGDTFIFHHGSKTLNRVDPDGGRGVRNLFDFYKIAREEVVPQQTKVASACRARLLNSEHSDLFLRGLRQQAKLADVIVLVNDRSAVWPEGEITRIVEEAGIECRTHEYTRGHDEIRDRSKLLEMAIEEGCNWFLSWDADEIFEDKFDRDYLQKLVNPPNPAVMSYSFHWYTFWDEAGEMWRVDSTFGIMYGARLARILPGYEVLKSDSGLHMGNVPTVQLAGSSRITSVRIKHYGYQTPAERRRKYEFYEAIDQVKDPQEIGNVDYSHLIPSVYQLAQWQEDCTITIGTCVLNEEIRLHNFLDRLWAFADDMVFVDTGSEDRTRELLAHYGATVINYDEESGEKWDRENPDYSHARNLIFPRVNTTWFWHHDIDEQLQPTDGKIAPLALMRRLLDKPGIDGYQFQFYNLTPQGVASHSQATRLVRNPSQFFYTGYTHETLDESSADKNIVIAPLQVMHTGWLVERERAKEKLKIYLRGNLKMMQDYPEDPRGWFNTALHLFDIDAAGTATTLIEQALMRRPSFAAARKELITQGAAQLVKQAEVLEASTPQGHLFHDYAKQVQQVLENIKADNTTLSQCPEHVIEVLREPGFETICAMVKKYDGIDILGGDEPVGQTSETESDSGSAIIVSPQSSAGNI